MKPKTKIILWDIETSLMVLSKFSLYPDWIGHKHVIQDWYIICASWMELSDTKVKSVDLTLDPKRYKKNPCDDYIVVKKLKEVLESADLIIAHNGEKFDLKKLNARLICHGLDPLPPIKSLDTKKEAKRIAAFTSNRLDYLGRLFGVGHKDLMVEDDWIEILKGNVTAIKKMVKYNKQDVLLLKKVYLKLRKYIRKHPVFEFSTDFICPFCKSRHLQQRGYYSTLTLRYKRYQCQDCGRWLKERASDGSDKPSVTPI